MDEEEERMAPINKDDDNDDDGMKKEHQHHRPQQQEQGKHTNNNNNNNKKKRREICNRCCRPKPRACICESLPQSLIGLQKSSVVVLQHPLELKHKNTNRSIPILELCLSSSDLHLCVGRRLGDQIDSTIMELLKPPNIPILLYPKQQQEQTEEGQIIKTFNLTTTLEYIQQQQQKQQNETTTAEKGGRIVLLALDATWKYAKEMNQANIQHKEYPTNLIQLSLEKEDFVFDDDDDSTNIKFQPRRFDTIRTVPNNNNKSKKSSNCRNNNNNTAATTTTVTTTTDNNNNNNDTWMCTAECIAYVLSRIENDPDIYTTIIKPIDTMVEKWKSFISQPKIRQQQQHPNQKNQKKQKQDHCPAATVAAAKEQEEEEDPAPVIKKQKTI